MMAIRTVLVDFPTLCEDAKRTFIQTTKLTAWLVSTVPLLSSGEEGLPSCVAELVLLVLPWLRRPEEFAEKLSPCLCVLLEEKVPLDLAAVDRYLLVKKVVWYFVYVLGPGSFESHPRCEAALRFAEYMPVRYGRFPYVLNNTPLT